ncbi:MAG: 30S ribosomal protein S18 [Actinobacteria bacterium]|nr:30S ribosomal protein S18 [Actinomycetota bacterium]
MNGFRQRKKVCYFCKENAPIDYKNYELLSRFMSEKAKIRSRRATGNCAKHQRKLAVAIKRAREMGLLPYVRRV